MADQRPIIYLTTGEVVEFNRAILLRADQRPSPVRDLGLLESAVQRPQNAAYYTESDIVEQAALYMTGIALNHPFVDGNKRTAYISGLTFLQMNDHISINPTLNDTVIAQWLIQVITQEITFATFLDQLRTRLSEANP